MGSFDEYMAIMSNDKEYGSDQEISAMAALYKRRIEVYRDNLYSPSHIYGESESTEYEPIRLKYTRIGRSYKHYDAIIIINSMMTNSGPNTASSAGTTTATTTSKQQPPLHQSPSTPTVKTSNLVKQLTAVAPPKKANAKEW